MKHFLDNLNVALVSGVREYPGLSPFNPSAVYPEYPYSGQTDASNGVYEMVRESLHLLRLDEANYGTAAWNPLGELISPGDRVLIKPNFVLHFNAGSGPLDAVVTHPVVIRAVFDYVMIALRGRGEIVIGDAPQMNCDLESMFRTTGMDGLRNFITEEGSRAGVSTRVVDFRQEQTFYRHGIVWDRKALINGGPKPIIVNAGPESWMEHIDAGRLYGADYQRGVTVKAHANHRHEYIIAPEVLASNVVISIPKLKVHRKVGTTLNLKNMVGINVDKNHLAHYRIGSPDRGGDEVSTPGWEDRMERALSDLLLGRNSSLGRYPFLAWRALRKILRRFQRSNTAAPFTFGNWHGNDTAWRMVLDLNRILLFADADGALNDKPVRRYFSVVDGIVGGEGEGPLHPDAYPAGAILAGFNPIAVDCIATRLMGFEYEKIPLYRNAIHQMQGWRGGFKIGDVAVRSNDSEWERLLENQSAIYHFRAPAGWRGTMECEGLSETSAVLEESFPEMISQ
ncbi:MAG: hypothetical protein DMF61_15125 [Blastocatellia bacterium AA13]|nr:MAG: hypothetical protein DMF61_15125 [Blastocatellia bacterium AA13]